MLVYFTPHHCLNLESLKVQVLFSENRALEKVHPGIHLNFDGRVSEALNECPGALLCPQDIRAKDTCISGGCQTRVAQAGSLA